MFKGAVTAGAASSPASPTHQEVLPSRHQTPLPPKIPCVLIYQSLELAKLQAPLFLSAAAVRTLVLTPTLKDSPGLLVKVIGVWFGQGQGLGGGVWDRGPVEVVGWEGGAVGDYRC